MPPPINRATTRVIKTLQPEDAGARRWAAEYGDSLVCVRYRVDLKRQRRQTTVELVVDDVPRLGALPVALRVAMTDSETRRHIIAAGGVWDQGTKLWHLPLDAVRRLGLTDRIVGQAAR
jgi:hypothetical protein